ncbi:hypothetical protein ABBQ38_014347 [Trebouxia sp. C0009 RCD-2024]
MLRALLSSSASRFAGGAAAAAATAPDVSHARSLQPRPALPAKMDGEASCLCKGLNSMRVDDGEWLLTNVRDGNVCVEPADVEDALSEVLGLSFRSKPALGQQSCGLECTTDDDDASSCVSFGTSADDHIERAEILPIRQCGSLLTALLNNPGVQQSVYKALEEDSNFTKFMEGFQGTSNLLPAPESPVVIKDVTDEVAEDFKEKANPLQAVMAKLGSGLVKLGEDVTSAGSHLGGMFVGLGNNLRGSILGAHAQTKKAVQEQSKNKEFWMSALGVLAIAVLSILCSKGRVKVRTA